MLTTEKWPPLLAGDLKSPWLYKVGFVANCFSAKGPENLQQSSSYLDIQLKHFDTYSIAGPECHRHRQPQAVSSYRWSDLLFTPCHQSHLTMGDLNVQNTQPKLATSETRISFKSLYSIYSGTVKEFCKHFISLRGCFVSLKKILILNNLPFHWGTKIAEHTQQYTLKQNAQTRNSLLQRHSPH